MPEMEYELKLPAEAGQEAVAGAKSKGILEAALRVNTGDELQDAAFAAADEKYAKGDKMQAFAGYMSLAIRGNEYAFFRLGQLYSEDLCTLPYSEEKAAKWLRKAAANDVKGAERLLRVVEGRMREPGYESDMEAMKQRYPSLSKANDFGQAAYALGQYSDVQGDYRMALKNFLDAEKLEVEDSYLYLMKYYDEGLGTDKDPEKAAYYRKKWREYDRSIPMNKELWEKHFG